MKAVTGAVLSLAVVFCFARGQTKKVEVPPFKIDIASWARTTRYEYRTIEIGSKQYLEMRQLGKEKWTRVEDVTCVHGPGRYESESFDYTYICQ